MKHKGTYNVLAVYSLLFFSGREHFSGILDAMSNTSNWRLSTVRPGECFTCADLANEMGKPYDGIILSMPGTDEVMEKIASLRIPSVLVDITDRRISARCDAIATVWTDNADVGRRAALHLVKRGEYKSAGYVHDFPDRFYSHERMMSFRRTMKQHGGCETSVFADGGMFERLRAWVRTLPKPAAVMAATDMCAADVINACRAEGIHVPSQVAVIGVDNDVSQHSKCGMSISSVVLNLRMMGQQAVRELKFLFDHPRWRGRPHEVLIPANGVFTGESTARSVSATRLVNIALDFISANFMNNISPEDVVAHLGCSRRLTELRFSQVSGTTIHKAIVNARMNEVRRRICRGDSVSRIVKDLRFNSSNQLYQMYKRHFGHTVRQTVRPGI